MKKKILIALCALLLVLLLAVAVVAFLLIHRKTGEYMEADRE